jgi:2-dehydropantoate 2-reductase
MLEVDRIHDKNYGSVMRHIIYGAGAIGGAIGARLHQARQNVLLIARGEHLAKIKKDGLSYRNPVETHTLDIPAVGHPSEIDFTPEDVVILTMKSQHTEAALADLESVASPDVPVVCCQNGVANEWMASRRFRHVYAMVVLLPATHIKPGEVLHFATGVGGLLDAGCFPTGTDETIERLCKNLTDAGFTADADPAALRLKYAKLLQNLGNSLQAICDIGRDAADLLKLARNEALACYEAAGIDCASRDEFAARRGDGMIMGQIEGADRTGGSSWQSLARGTGDIEADFLNGEICLLGKLYGIPTPANETFRYLANRAARERWEPGRMTVDEVMAEIKRLTPAD